MEITLQKINQLLDAGFIKEKRVLKRYAPGQIVFSSYWNEVVLVLEVTCNKENPIFLESVTVMNSDGKIRTHGTAPDQRLDFELIF